jgi:serine/threonine protein kinase
MDEVVQAWAALDSEALSDPSSAFQVHELLGEGAFNRVHRATGVRGGQKVAIKQLPLLGDPDELLSLRKEVELLSSVRHECIVTYHGAFRTSSQLWIVMEFAGDCMADVRPPHSSAVLMPANQAELIMPLSLSVSWWHLWS